MMISATIDCDHCQSAGSVVRGICQVCMSEHESARRWNVVPLPRVTSQAAPVDLNVRTDR